MLTHEADSLHRSKAMMHQLLERGGAVVSTLNAQGETIKVGEMEAAVAAVLISIARSPQNVQRKILDVANVLGLSQSTVRAIERRLNTDKWIVLAGCGAAVCGQADNVGAVLNRVVCAAVLNRVVCAAVCSRFCCPSEGLPPNAAHVTPHDFVLNSFVHALSPMPRALVYLCRPMRQMRLHSQRRVLEQAQAGGRRCGGHLARVRCRAWPLAPDNCLLPASGAG